MGSVNEVKVYIDMIKDLGYIEQEAHQQLKAKYESVNKQLYRLIQKWTKYEAE